MGSLLQELESRFDHVILDSAPLLPVTDAAVLAASADGAIMVIRHRRTTHEQVERAAHALASVKGRLLGSVVNVVPRGRRLYGYSRLRVRPRRAPTRELQQPTRRAPEVSEPRGGSRADAARGRAAQAHAGVNGSRPLTACSICPPPATAAVHRRPTAAPAHRRDRTAATGLRAARRASG
jgi:hypothetical protein